MRSVYFFPLLLIASGCVSMETSGIVRQTPPDCRQPRTIFQSFTVYARDVTWQGNQVTLTFVMQNITREPMNFSSGVGAFITIELADENGVRYAPAQFYRSGAYASNAFQGGGAMRPINPGGTIEGTATFDVRQGSYTFHVGREMYRGGTQIVRPNEFVCQVPIV